jgi:hypothetical protein
VPAAARTAAEKRMAVCWFCGVISLLLYIIEAYAAGQSLSKTKYPPYENPLYCYAAVTICHL